MTAITIRTALVVLLLMNLLKTGKTQSHKGFNNKRKKPTKAPPSLVTALGNLQPVNDQEKEQPSLANEIQKDSKDEVPSMVSTVLQPLPDKEENEPKLPDSSSLTQSIDTQIKEDPVQIEDNTVETNVTDEPVTTDGDSEENTDDDSSVEDIQSNIKEDDLEKEESPQPAFKPVPPSFQPEVRSDSLADQIEHEEDNSLGDYQEIDPSRKEPDFLINNTKKPETKNDKEPTEEENESKGFFEILTDPQIQSDISHELQSMFDQLFQNSSNLLFPDLEVLDLSKENGKKVAQTTDITLDKAFVIGSHYSFYEVKNLIDTNKFFSLTLTGIGSVKLQVLDRNKRIIVKRQFNIDSLKDGNLIPISGYLMQEGTILQIRMHKESIMEMSAKLEILEYYEMDFNGNTKIFTPFIHQLHYKVKNPKKYLKQDVENRLQFILQTSLKKQKLTGLEQVDMFINKKAGFPAKDNYDMKASGNVGNGLIKTLSKGNEYYCISDDCDYNVTINVREINYVFFFPTVFGNKAEIKFHNYLYLLEEVEAGENITYKLAVPKIKGDWIFSVVPFDGDVDFYINPDFMPKTLQDYKYKVMGPGAEEIMITHRESVTFGFSYELFYITYSSSNKNKNSIFKFEAKRLKPGERKFIIENYNESGVVAKDEIINYYMDFTSDQPTDYAVNIDLTSISGNADLYVKECLSYEKACLIEPQDVLNVRKPNAHMLYRNRIFRYSTLEADREFTKKDNILLTMNCMGRDRNVRQNPFKNDYPVSRTCVFAVGVHCRNANNKYGTLYKLVTYGQNVINSMTINDSESIEISAKETNVIKLALNPSQIQNHKYVVFNVVSLSGRCNLYLSWNNRNPSKADFDAVIQVQNKEDTAIHSKRYLQAMDLSEHGDSDNIYISITGQTYCLLDLYTSLVNEYEEAISKAERIKLNKLFHRGIESDFISSIEGEEMYYYSFYFELDYTLHHTKDIDITMDAFSIGLEICVQADTADYDPNKPCDYTSTAEALTIPNNRDLKKGRIFSLTVFKRKNGKPATIFFPIEFSVMVSIDNIDKGAEILAVGKSHTKNLAISDSITYSVSLNRVKRSALIILTSEDPTISATVSHDELDFSSSIAVLDYSKFAIRIKRDNQFERKYCSNNNCQLFIKVSNSGLTKSHFSLTFTTDENPINLKQGAQIFIPSDEPMYLVTEANTNNSLSFNVASEKTSSVAYAQVYTEREFHHGNLTHKFTENYFDFKTHIDTEVQIIITPEIIQKRNAAVVSYLVVPKLDVSYYSSNTVVYDRLDRTSVSLHSDIKKLDAFSQVSDHIKKGDFKYYYFNVNEPHDIAIILSVNSGEADLYINRGMYNLTTTNKYWKKRTSYKDDELVITKDMFKNPGDMTGTYTIGVHAREFSQFSILYAPDRYNIIKLHYQRLVDTKIEKDKEYYFDFYNKHAKFNSILYTQDSDISVSVLNYDERKNQNFIDLITTHGNYLQHFVYKKGDVPRKKISNAKLDKESHYIIKMKALDKDARVNFAIYDKTKPLMGYMEKTFHFALDKSDEQVFMIKLDSDYREVDVDIKLKFGEIDYYVSDTANFKDEAHSIKKPGQDSTKFSVKEVQQSNDIVIFKTIFIKVKAKEFSNFSIFVKPVDKFKELKAMETELAYTNTQRDQYFYFVIEDTQLKQIQNFTIDIYHINYYGEKPELLFVAEDDIVLNEGTAFMPMPILDFFENKHSDFEHLEIRPDITKGFYIVKVPKRKKVTPIKIRVRINNESIIEPNGIYNGRLNLKEQPIDKYSVFLPSAGEFRFVMESCARVKIDTALYHHAYNSTTIKFENRFFQAYQFLNIDATQKKLSKMYSVAHYNIRRGIIDAPGLVRFNITEGTPDNYQRKIKDDRYYFVSEFKPVGKELFMYDYVDMFHDGVDSDFIPENYEFTDKKKSLKIKARIPRFKDQLLMDYPNLVKIKIVFNFYLLADDDFLDELKNCGMSAINYKDHVKRSTTKLFTREMINKNNDFFTMGFYKFDVDKFKDKKDIMVFCSMAISYFENDEDEYNISLDDKYANIPYFVMKIKNDRFGMSKGLSVFLLVLGIIVFLFLFFCIMKCLRGKTEESSPKGYERSGQSVNKLEMSEISSNV